MESELPEAVNAVARALVGLGLNGAATNMGAIESHSEAVKEAASTIAHAIYDLADAIRNHSA